MERGKWKRCRLEYKTVKKQIHRESTKEENNGRKGIEIGATSG